MTYTDPPKKRKQLSELELAWAVAGVGWVMAKISDVHRFLVTGPDGDLQRFHLAVAMRLNAIERRKATVMYTCFADDVAIAMQQAEAWDLTIEEVMFTASGEEYAMRRLGSHGLTWKPATEQFLVAEE